MLLSYIIMLFWAYTFLYISCEFGEYVTSEFNKLNDEFFQSEWYLLPLEIQQRLPIFIASIQQPVEMHGFGNCVYTRESFKKVSLNIKICLNNEIIFMFKKKCPLFRCQELDSHILWRFVICFEPKNRILRSLVRQNEQIVYILLF